ncbi:C-type lectin domain family 12 member B [Athalia rosae]|uniref:C-type lectin domain family 12 member B n=1 Tax=Athalia rosae TaxID=37344 RepID=UPI0020340988|nr:C-type lectin domain family 12 member B [Athalia rosae]
MTQHPHGALTILIMGISTLATFKPCSAIYLPSNLTRSDSYAEDESSEYSCSSESNPGPWSGVLEDWVLTSDLSPRSSRVMKIGDNNAVTVSPSGNSPNKRDVSETDLYLLGAIEKLVYRVDFMEKRLRRAEELLYYVISGNNHEKDPCPSNYTRIGKGCYHFGAREFDWKSSASLCRGLGGALVELESVEENQDLVAHLQTDKKVRGKSFWTGGLNPGLLWIWSASARPVHQDTKQTVLGDGRCLNLQFNPASRVYSYRGEDCGSRHRYICELSKDDEAANKLERTARALKSKSS